MEKLTYNELKDRLTKCYVNGEYGKSGVIVFTEDSFSKQFSVESFERKIPENAAAILRYLSAGAIRGIGPATAVKIVEKFGADTLNIIADNPKAVEEYKGGKKKAIGSLVGQVMKQSKGKANPQMVNQLLAQKLD